MFLSVIDTKFGKCYIFFINIVQKKRYTESAYKLESESESDIMILILSGWGLTCMPRHKVKAVRFAL